MQKHNKIFTNAAWIIACRIVQSLLAMVINMLTARYLGPSNYGIINYAASLVAFVEPFTLLGLNSILVQELLERPAREGETLGTSIVMSMISSVLCICGMSAFARVTNAGETETIIVCVLYSTILFFKALELIQYWYQAKLLSKYPSVVMLCAYLVISLYRIILLVNRKSIYWFSVVNAFDALLIATALLVLYYKLGGQRLRFSASRAKQLLSKSRYFIVSTLMISIFSQTDKVMLKLMIGEAETGYYSAAIACALISNFVFTAIFDSARPSILSSKKADQTSFELNVTRLYSVIIFLSVVQSVFIGIFAKPFIHILYGTQFDQAVDVLRVLVWYTVFSYAGMVRSIWILAEGIHRYLWVINLSGALMNILLNVLLIPHFGAVGAAAASILTQFFTNIVLGYLIAPLYRNNQLMLRSLHPRHLFDLYRTIRK